MNGHMRPQDIEKRSFAIITAELGERTFPDGESEVVKRVIHTTADFDYADSLAFSPGAVGQAREALASGATVVTDTNMALAGVNKGALQALGGRAVCYMADEAVARAAGARGVTRAAVSMEYAALLDGPLIFAVGNAPTALIRLHELIRVFHQLRVIVADISRHLPSDECRFHERLVFRGEFHLGDVYKRQRQYFVPDR